MVASLAVLVVVWLAVAIRIVIFPVQDPVAPADAIVVLGPVDDWRVEFAYQLVDDGIADTLLFTASDEAESDDYCTPREPGVVVECRYPDPYTTQGEATWARETAGERGWDRLVVITVDAHIERARFIFEHCLDGVEVAFPAEPDPDYNPARLAYQFAYQTAVWVKAAFITPGCARYPHAAPGVSGDRANPASLESEGVGHNGSGREPAVLVQRLLTSCQWARDVASRWTYYGLPIP